MKKPLLVQIKLIILLTGYLLLPFACEAGNLNGQEIGDVVFRRLVWPFEKHSAIYCEYENGDPEEDSNCYVVEEEGPDVEDDARQITFQEFKSGGDYFGSKGFGYISKDKRVDIKETAIDLIDLDYTRNYMTKCVD